MRSGTVADAIHVTNNSGVKATSKDRWQGYILNAKLRQKGIFKLLYDNDERSGNTPRLNHQAKSSMRQQMRQEVLQNRIPATFFAFIFPLHLRYL